MSARRASPVRFSLIAALAVFAMACADRSAGASCGDYLTIPGATADDMAGDVHPPMAPCHGPNCSAGQPPAETPLTAIPAKITSSDTDSAALAASAEADVPANAGRWCLASEWGTVSRPSAPFHPPRPF